MNAPATTTTLPLVVAPSQGDYSKSALIAGLLGLAASATGLALGLQQGDPRYFLGWLIAAAFWLSLGFGALFLIMIWYVFDAGWPVILRRQLENFLGSLKYIMMATLPLVLTALLASSNEGVAWQWLNENRLNYHGQPVGQDPLYTAKSAFLNKGTFLFLLALFWGTILFVAESLRRHSYAMDQDGDLAHQRACRKLAGFGIIATGLGITLTAIYFFKTLEYHWFSTMYGVWFFAASIRAATAATLLLGIYLAARGPLQGLFKHAHSYLLGCMLLAFTVFWAYISFSQYFLIYSANIPEETFWYQIRELNPETQQKNSWWLVSMGLIFGHFFLPFLYLLWYKAKFGRAAVFICIWTLAFHLLDLYWNILPGRVFLPATHHYSVREFAPHWIDLTTLIGIGGIAVWAYLQASRRHKVIPIRDPHILESIHAHE